MIFVGTLHANGLSYMSNRDNDINCSLTLMRARRIACNIYKQFGSVVVGDIVLVEFDNNATKLRHMRLGRLSERGMTELHKRTLFKGVCTCKMKFYNYRVLE